LILIADNDAILKLAAFDLLDVTCDLFGVVPSSVIVLDTARHKFRKGRASLVKQYTEEGLNRAIAFVENASPILEETPLAEAKMLSDIEFIDPGEGQLFAYTRDRPDSIVLTGDKRCLRALAKAQKARPVYDRLSNRIVCLEVLIHSLIKSVGFVEIRSGVGLALKCDKSLNICFGWDGTVAEEGVIESLGSYVRDLEKDVGPNWLKPPFLILW
jgi:hypothetical protein